MPSGREKTSENSTQISDEGGVFITSLEEWLCFTKGILKKKFIIQRSTLKNIGYNV